MGTNIDMATLIPTAVANAKVVYLSIYLSNDPFASRIKIVFAT